jgi:hypothetical protein
MIWTLKSPRQFLSLSPKPSGIRLSVASQNRRTEIGVGHTSRSSGLLYVEGSLARIFPSGIKTGEDTTAGGYEGCVRVKLKTDGLM